MSGELGKKAVKGAFWASVDKVSSMVIQFAVNLILARLLLPDDFGAIGLLTIFIVVSGTLVDGGFASALIQKKDATQTDFSTVFFWNLGLSTFLYVVLFVAAPWIADFYHIPLLCNILRVLGLSLIINAFRLIPINKLTKELAFKKLALIHLTTYIASAALAIYMAYRGAGAWSLVAFTLAQGGMSGILFWLFSDWRPTLEFSWSSFKRLFSFGGYILAANVLQQISQNVQGLIIGRKFSSTQMGYYSQAQKLDSVFSYSVPQVIVSVMYPVYSQIQDDLERLRSVLAMNLRVISYLIFPMLALLAFMAEPLITGLYGDKWLPSVPYFRIFCVGGIFVCLQNLNFYAVASVGKSRQLFLWSLYKWSCLLAFLLIGMQFGMYGILWGVVLSQFNIFCVNAWLASRHVGLTVVAQLLIVLRAALFVALCLLPALVVCVCFDWHLFVGGSIFILIYLIVSYTFKLRSFTETIDILNKFIHRK